MYAQVIASALAAVMLALAAIQLQSPISLIGLAVVCMIAWLSHIESLPEGVRALLTYFGLLAGCGIGLYLLTLAV